MKKILFLTFILIIFIANANAFFINWYDDIDSFVKNAESIIIVKCISVLTKDIQVDTNTRSKVNVLAVLKGSKEQEITEISSFLRLEEGKKYLLSCNMEDSIFKAELSAILLDDNFDISALNECRDLKEKILYIFKRRLSSISNEIELLNFEKKRLKKILKQK